MANIESVRLPNGTTYDINDANAVQVADMVDNLASTAVNEPLSANMGRVLNEQSAAVTNVYGSKNLLPYPFYQTTKTDNGITFTDNGDSTINVSGVASANTSMYLTSNYTGTPIGQGDYKINGCPAGGDATSYYMQIEVYNSLGQTVSTHYDYGSGVDVSVASNQFLHITIIVKNGTDLTTPITFYPMIWDARITDNTFAPYAKTNKQLTDDKAERADISTINVTGTTNTTGAQIDAGTFFYLNGTLCKALANIAVNAAFTLNTNFKVDSVGEEITGLQKNKMELSSPVDLSPYTDLSNPFEIPTDGYLSLSSATTIGGFSSLTLYGAEAWAGTNGTLSLSNPTNQYQGNMLFVRKGMYVTCPDLEPGHVARFIPLT